MARQQDGTDSHACAEFRLVTWPLKCSWPTLNSGHVGEISSLWKCPVLSFTWQGILGLCPPAARLPPLTKGILGIFCSYMARKKVWVFLLFGGRERCSVGPLGPHVCVLLLFDLVWVCTHSACRSCDKTDGQKCDFREDMATWMGLNQLKYLQSLWLPQPSPVPVAEWQTLGFRSLHRPLIESPNPCGLLNESLDLCWSAEVAVFDGPLL